MTPRAVVTLLAAAASLQLAPSLASTPAGTGEAAPATSASAPTASMPAAAPEGTEKRRRLRFRDEKNACAPGALGEADIRATLTAKPAATEQPKRSDK